MSMETSNRPHVQVVYRATGFEASFEVGWKHTDGHTRFRDQVCELLDGLHKTWNQNERGVVLTAAETDMECGTCGAPAGTLCVPDCEALSNE